jgi:hypothetical protein
MDFNVLPTFLTVAKGIQGFILLVAIVLITFVWLIIRRARRGEQILVQA